MATANVPAPGNLNQARAAHNWRAASRNFALDLEHELGHTADSLAALIRATVLHAAHNGGAA